MASGRSLSPCASPLAQWRASGRSKRPGVALGAKTSRSRRRARGQGACRRSPARIARLVWPPAVAWLICRTQTTALARLEAFSWQGWSHDAAIRGARHPAGPQPVSVPGRRDLIQRRQSEGLTDRAPVRQTYSVRRHPRPGEGRQGDRGLAYAEDRNEDLQSTPATYWHHP